MAILRERVGWSKPKTRRGPDLNPDEAKAVKVALGFLHNVHGSWPALGQAMGLKMGTVVYAASPRGGVTAGVALRAARAAGVPLEEILSGAFPKPGVCPHCGRG